MRCMVVTRNHSAATPIAAHRNSDRSGRPPRPPKPPPSPPPNLPRLIFRNSSSEPAGPRPLPAPRRFGGSFHGPDGSSPAGGSFPPPEPGGEPQGPLLSLKKARPRAPQPEKMVIGP